MKAGAAFAGAGAARDAAGLTNGLEEPGTDFTMLLDLHVGMLRNHYSRAYGSWVFATLLLLVSCRSQPDVIGPQPGLHDVDAAQLKAQSREGLVLVHAWAEWCPPCIKEMPMLLLCDREHPELRLVLVSMDPPVMTIDTEARYAAWEAPRPWLRRTGPDGAFIDAGAPTWSGTLPASWLLKEGEVVLFWEGEWEWARLSAAVTAAATP